MKSVDVCTFWVSNISGVTQTLGYLSKIFTITMVINYDVYLLISSGVLKMSILQSASMQPRTDIPKKKFGKLSWLHS